MNSMIFENGEKLLAAHLLTDQRDHAFVKHHLA